MNPWQPCTSPFSSLSTQGWAGPGAIPLLGARTSSLGPWVIRGGKAEPALLWAPPVGVDPPVGAEPFWGG